MPFFACFFCIATRVKSYQSSGFDKIVDPDGGIHLRRIHVHVRLEWEMRTQLDQPQRIEWPTDLLVIKHSYEADKKYDKSINRWNKCQNSNIAIYLPI